VDYPLRRRLLAEIHSWNELRAEDRRSRVVSLGRSCADPRLKLLVTYRLLALRSACFSLFFRGQYVPLETTGPLQQHVVAFGWRQTAELPLEVLAVIPRQVRTLMADRSADNHDSLWADGAWGDTEVLLPPSPPDHFRCVFTERIHGCQGSFPVSSLLNEFPLAVLRRETPTKSDASRVPLPNESTAPG
jgi:maltooligosyltrehalose synthase